MLTARRCRGAATVEFYVVALFAMLPLCLGMLQLALLLAENHHVDHALFLATRQAAMAGGALDPARRAFAQASTVLFVGADEELAPANVAARVTRAYAEALADQVQFARLRILSPDADAEADFALARNGVRVIPNDALQYRSASPGRRSGLTLQQANMLRLEVSWCRPLVVPFIRQILIGALLTLDRNPWHQFCYSRGRVPLRSESTSPMQSDFRASS
jgi:hypothetical protein